MGIDGHFTFREFVDLRYSGIPLLEIVRRKKVHSTWLPSASIVRYFEMPADDAKSIVNCGL